MRPTRILAVGYWLLAISCGDANAQSVDLDCLFDNNCRAQGVVSPIRQEDKVLPPATQRQMVESLCVEPIGIASDHAVFTIRPHELAPLLVG